MSKKPDVEPIEAKLAPFEDWFLEVAYEIGTVQAFMQVRLSDNPSALTQQLTLAESWHARLTKLLADANAQLDLAEFRNNGTINREGTVFDRQLELKSLVVTERRIRDIVEGLVESIKNRLILGMSIGKANAGERTRMNA